MVLRPLAWCDILIIAVSKRNDVDGRVRDLVRIKFVVHD